MSKSESLFRNDNFKKAFCCVAACFITYIISFASPYWLQTYHSVPLDFKNMGLWEICFSEYFFREDSFPKPFVGCYWSLGIDLEFRRDQFNPGWFVWVQVFSVIVLFSLFVATMIMCLILLNCMGDEREESRWLYWRLSTALSALCAFTGILLFIMVVIVGYKSGDRNWMARADLIWLSWAYAFAVLCSFIAFLAAYYFALESKINWNAKAPETQLFGLPFRQADAGLDPPTDHESVFQ